MDAAKEPKVVDLTAFVTRRRFYDDDEFFDEGNEQRAQYIKCAVVSTSSSSTPEVDTGEMAGGGMFHCDIENCRLLFRTAAEYASHYAVRHRHRCETCSAVLPNVRLLDMHVEERHDSYFLAMSERTPSYKCLVEMCSSLFWNKHERSIHLQTVHLFPKKFCYDMQKRSQKKRQNKKIKSKSTRRNDGDDVDDLVQHMSQISFGRTKNRNKAKQHWSKNTSSRVAKVTKFEGGVAKAMESSTFGHLSDCMNGGSGGGGDGGKTIVKMNRRQRRALARSQQNADLKRSET